MSKDNGGQVFPTERSNNCASCGETLKKGMTLRDYFMAHAPDVPQDYENLNKKYLSQLSVIVQWRNEYADAMIKER